MHLLPSSLPSITYINNFHFFHSVVHYNPDTNTTLNTLLQLFTSIISFFSLLFHSFYHNFFSNCFLFHHLSFFFLSITHIIILFVYMVKVCLASDNIKINLIELNLYNRFNLIYNRHNTSHLYEGNQLIFIFIFIYFLLCCHFVLQPLRSSFQPCVSP